MRVRRVSVYGAGVVGAVCLAGCVTPRTAARLAVPANLGLAYFGTVGIHEGGHVLGAEAVGLAHGDVSNQTIRVDFLPVRDKEGQFHMGLTTVRHAGEWSDTDMTWFRIAGPATSFAAHIACRELLKVGVGGAASPYLQPSLAWLSFGNQLSYYGHVVAGLARIKSTDLGQEDVWISVAFLVGGLSYDLFDLFSDPDPTGALRFKVLIGEEFYSGSGSRLGIVSSPGFLGLHIAW